MPTSALINLAATLALAAFLTFLFFRFAWRDPQSHALFTLFGGARSSAVVYFVFALCLVAMAWLFMDNGGCADCAVSQARAYGRSRVRLGSDGSSVVFYLMLMLFGSLAASLCLKAWSAARDG
jgi:hypothetical protein